MFVYLLAFVVIFLSWLWFKSRPSKFPPGPLCLPVIGNIHNAMFDEKFPDRLRTLHQKYGPVISVSIMGHKTWDVWVEDFEIAKDFLYDSRFASRRIFSLFGEMRYERGIFLCPGDEAKSKRKFFLNALRLLGVGKSLFSLGIQEETESLLLHLEKFVNTNLNISAAMAYTTNNIISKLLFNTSYSFDDKSYKIIHQKLMRKFELLNPTLPIWVLPFLISKRMSQTKELMRLRVEFLQFLQENFNTRRPKDDENREHECFSDFIWEALLKESGKLDAFPEEDIPFMLADLFMAGLETTMTTLAWAMLNMIHRPDFQEKVYEELRREFPEREEIIPVSGVQSCHFTMATINEVQRFTPTVFSTADHTSNVDVENFHGFKIPKGTRMFPNSVAINRDPKFWKFPTEFNPENFLDPDGCFVKSQYLMPFGVGLRACPGEAVAKLEMHLVFANVLRRFKICPADALPPLIPKVSLVSNAPYYEVRLEKREK